MIEDSKETRAHAPLAGVGAIRGAASRKEPTPKRIWMFWHQGFSSAPPLVEACVSSWRETNPGWEICLLDKSSAEPYLRRADIPWNWLTRLPYEKRANILRMRLLTEEGGIWADATAYCLRPLEEWIPRFMDAGFFCFRDPGPDRLVANWFLASVPGNRLARLWRDAHEAFWRRKELLHHSSYTGDKADNLPPTQRLLLRVMHRWFDRNTRTTDLWFHPFVRSFFHSYPYCVMHYIYAYNLRRDPEWRQLASRMPYCDAKPMLAAYRMTEDEGELQEFVRRGRDAELPLLKVSWKPRLSASGQSSG